MAQQETRLLAGGIDSDNAAFAIDKTSLLKSVNLRALRQDAQNAGSNSFIEGNVEMAALSAILPTTGFNTLLGKCSDELNKKLYIFIHNSASGNFIFEYDNGNNTARIIIQDSSITDGTLGWDENTYVSCDVAEVNGAVILAWVAASDVKYVRLDQNYGIASIPLSQLSLLVEPGIAPLIATRLATTGIVSTIQTLPVQFMYRFTNSEGFVSVLSPYSLTSMAPRPSDIVANANAGNTITVSLPLVQKIPANWRQVDFIAKIINPDADTNIFYLIKSWRKGNPTDETAVNNHNTNVTALTLTAWAGTTIEVIDPLYVAKQFDAMPQIANALAFVASRLFLGNITEGYDTPVIIPTLTLSQTTFTAATPTTTTLQPFLLIGNAPDFGDFFYIAIYVRLSGKTYLLPPECASGIAEDFDSSLYPTVPYLGKITKGLFSIPYQISKENLIETKETRDPGTPALSTNAAEISARLNIIREANGLNSVANSTGAALRYDWNGVPLGTAGTTYTQGHPPSILVENSVSDLGTGGQSRSFLPATYTVGIEYYDSSLRKSGRQDITTFTPPAYSITAPTFTQLAAITMPSGVQTAIPDWAAYYGLTLSKPERITRFGMFFGGIIRAAFRNAKDELIFRDRSELLSPAPGSKVYGIAIPIPSKFNYSYSSGDFVKYSMSSEGSSPQYDGSARIIAADSGYIIIQFTNDGNMHRLADGFSEQLFAEALTGGASMARLTQTDNVQNKVAIIVYSGISSENQGYEVAAFGPVLGTAGAKQYGAFFDSGTLTHNILGDANTVARFSNSGGGTGLTMSPADNTLYWVNDLGRISPIDNVGQKDLYNVFRWSNTAVPGASVSGYASFDAGDYKTTDSRAGRIVVLLLTTKDEQGSGQLVILCKNGSFTALVGQQQIRNADGSIGLVASAEVVGDVNPTRGGYGCSSPRSAVTFEGKAWWVDYDRQEVIEFNQSGADSVSKFKAARLWKDTLTALGDPAKITAGINPFTSELMVSGLGAGIQGTPLETVPILFNAFDCLSQYTSTTFLYNWEENRWTGEFKSGAEYLRIDSVVFGWRGERLWKEFVSTAGIYYGVPSNLGILSVPFNEGFPAVKSPMNIQVQANRAPDQTWIKIDDGQAAQVAGVRSYRLREGVWMADISRNRLSRNAGNATQYTASGINGYRLKGSNLMVCFVWDSANGNVRVSTVSLSSDISSGHLPAQGK